MEKPHTTEETLSPTAEHINQQIEQQAKKIPNLMFMGLAVGAIVTSAILASKNKDKGLANFVGIWAPTLLLFGIYNKLVKIDDELQPQQATHLH